MNEEIEAVAQEVIEESQLHAAADVVEDDFKTADVQTDPVADEGPRKVIVTKDSSLR